MKEIRLSESVDVPIERAFKYLTDTENGPKVFRGIRELRKLTPGPLREGTRLLAVRNDFDEEFVVAEFTPSTSYVIEGGIPRLATRIGYQLEPAGSATRVTLSFAWQLRGAWLMIAPLFRRQVTKEYRQTIADVSKLLGALGDDQHQTRRDKLSRA